MGVSVCKLVPVMNCHNFNHHCADFCIIIIFSLILGVGRGGGGGHLSFPPSVCMKLWLVYMCGLCVWCVCVGVYMCGVCVLV